MTAFFAGLALGIAGSAHCAGMCGPLVLALGPGASARRATRVRIAGTYHSGRLLIYVGSANCMRV